MINLELDWGTDSCALEVGEDIFSLLEGRDDVSSAVLSLYVNGRKEWVLGTFKRRGKNWYLIESKSKIIWDYHYCVCGREKEIGPGSLGGNVIKIGK